MDAMFHGRALRFLYKRAPDKVFTDPGAERWQVQPLYVDSPEIEVSIIPSDRVIPLNPPRT